MTDVPTRDGSGVASAAEPSAGTAYEVLARKYRPGHFRDLIGQQAMVQTLTNAFASGRIAHAFVLTGVRGVGKTTTARIIAKGLNCEAASGPTIDPCGVCRACRDIAAGRHVEVIEMDAASNTGVDYIREINEAVRYRPAEVRYKVYIIDEVHMLSTSSFNALLKTLEEPPAHVIFILATTEIRKVPVTVLSRCQRFDLRRIEPEVMTAHLQKIAAAEGAKVETPALALLTRAAEGSVRDALSLLDQALAQSEGDGPVAAEAVRAMLGVADRGRIIDLFDAVMRGDAAAALSELGQQVAEGVEPGAVLRDLAELTHRVSVLKVAPVMAEDPTMGPDEQRRGLELADRLSMRVLGRAWQMLLKALEELAIAPNARMAAEMAIIRLTHVAELPPPEELIKRLEGLETGAGSAPGGGNSGAHGMAPGTRSQSTTQVATAAPGQVSASDAPGGSGPSGGFSDDRPEAPPEVAAAPPPATRPKLSAVAGGAVFREPAARAAISAVDALETAPTGPDSLAAICALLAEHREMRLFDLVERFVEPVSVRPGRLEFSPAAGAPQDLAGRLSEALKAFTGQRWSVVVTDTQGAPTIAAARAASRIAREAEAAAHPLVAAALEVFPGATIQDIRSLRALGPEPGGRGSGRVAGLAPGEYLAALPEDGDDAGEDGPYDHGPDDDGRHDDGHEAGGADPKAAGIEAWDGRGPLVDPFEEG